MSVSKIRILIIEDDESTANVVKSLLTESGYEVVHCFDANEALEWLKLHKPDLIISDINLPGISGMQFCSMVRNNPATSSIPLIMLTAMQDELHKVESLKGGADDYITKPYSGRELIARIEALLRRIYYHNQKDRILISGSLSLNEDTGEVTIGKSRVELLPKEFALLSMFLKNKGRILRFSFIAETVWGENVIATRDTIKTAIHRLREKLGKYSDCIESIPGLGYKWIEK